jgi:hypothetical protein
MSSVPAKMTFGTPAQRLLAWCLPQCVNSTCDLSLSPRDCVARVRVDRARGAVAVEKLTLVVDAGTIVHPDSAQAQVEGASLWGLCMGPARRIGIGGRAAAGHQPRYLYAAAHGRCTGRRGRIPPQHGDARRPATTVVGRSPTRFSWPVARACATCRSARKRRCRRSTRAPDCHCEERNDNQSITAWHLRRPPAAVGA